MKYIGMDLHKTTTMISWVDEDNCIMRPFQLPTTLPALEAFAQGIGPAKVALEATRNHAFVHDLLAAAGLEVLVAHPKHIEAIGACKKKSDRHDAITLARLLKADLLTAAYVPPLEIRLLRELVREYLRLAGVSIRARNWVRAALAQHGLQCPFADICGPGAQRWLAGTPLHPVRRGAVERNLQLLAFVQQRLVEVREEIIARVKDDPQVKLLITIPGVGYLLAAAIRAEIGEVSRFTSHRQLASYAGVVTTTRESGGQVRHGHITKEGAVVLRWALGMAVCHLLRKPGPLKQFYEKLAVKHGKKSARTAAAHKLVRYIFAMLTYQRTYGERPVRQAFSSSQSCVGQAR